MTKADKKGQKKAPILRFKGFTDDWEQRKLKNLITEPLSYGLNVSSKEYDGIHKYLRITDIDEKSRKFNKDKLTSPDIKFNSSSKKYLLSNNDIVFARTGASTGKTYMYQKEDGIVYYAGFLIKASLSSNFDNNFIFQQTYRKRYYQRVKVISQRSGQPGINSKEYGNFDFLITQIEEQNKIGKLFKIFDNLLALYERKLKLLSRVKKYFLDNLFAEKEYPNLRFKEFTDAWEQRKLGEISETYSGGTPKVSIKSFYNKKEIPFIRSSDIHKNTTELYITKEGLEESSAKLVSKGQILYALYGATSGEVDISKIDGAINQAILAINTHDNINYFIMLFLNKNKDKIIKKYIQGGQGNLSAKIVKNININITSKKEEKEISTFIKKFEKIFTLYENKQQHLTEIKKTLLNTMFI